MAFFKKRKQKKEGNKAMTTLEQIRKAYDDRSDDDKKNFKQSIADRVHESLGEQEHDDGDEDSQSAEAREHEALGAEHAAGEGDVSELHETDPEDGKTDNGEEVKALREEIAKLAARLELVERTPQKADDDKSKKLDALQRMYN